MHLSTFINAPRKKVWEIMLADETYRMWASVFMEGSYYQGNWKEGSKILFLAPNKDGQGEGGMISRIAENRPYEFISIEHLGMMKDGVEDTTSDAIKNWVGAHENYTFIEKDGGTELLVDMDVVEEEKIYMEEAWQKGLEKLKVLIEKE